MTVRRAPASLLAFALLAGLAHAASVAAPWSGQPQWWLQLISLAVLAALVQRSASLGQAFAAGWVFSTAWLAGTFWWMYISMHVYGGLPAVLAAVAVLALALFLGSYYAVACAVIAAARKATVLGRALAFAGAWLVAELVRATWFTGFPWGASGYAHVEGPLAFLARHVGVYGIGFVGALLAWGLSLLAHRTALRSRAYWAAAAAAVALLAACNMVAPAADTAARPSLSVALLQGNIPQDEKFEGGTGIPLALEWYGRQLRESRASLTVTAETAIPMLPQQLPQGYLEAISARFQQGSQAALVGIPLGSFKDGYSNSVVGFAPSAPMYRYDKHHLVPFGEFVPPLFKWFTRMMNIPLGDFNRGASGQPPFAWAGQRVAPNICYEDLFGEELAVLFSHAARAPTILVNLSNIAWFGNTVAIDQHLQISRMRSLEFERPMIRATNTGATVIIDHRGRVTHTLPRHTRGVLAGEVEGRDSITPYAWWVSRWGLAPLWLAGLVLVAGAFMRRGRGARP